MTQTDLLTARECADYRRCSLRTLDRERELGAGCPYVRIGSRIYYRRGDVDQFIAAHICGGDRPSPGISAPPPHKRGRPPKISADFRRHLDELTGKSAKVAS